MLYFFFFSSRFNQPDHIYHPSLRWLISYALFTDFSFPYYFSSLFHASPMPFVSFPFCYPYFKFFIYSLMYPYPSHLSPSIPLPSLLFSSIFFPSFPFQSLSLSFPPPFLSLPLTPSPPPPFLF